MINKAKMAALLMMFTIMNIDLGHALIVNGEMDNLKNDKEIVSNSIKQKELDRIQRKYSNKKFNNVMTLIFFDTVQDFIEDKHNLCELRLIESFRRNLDDNLIENDQKSIEEYFKVLRLTHNIDDIFYNILKGSNDDYFQLEKLNINKTPTRSFLKREKLLRNNSLEDLYKNFSEWPDEKEVCAYNSFIELRHLLKDKKGRPSKNAKELKILNLKAYEANIISLSTYRGLEYLRKESNINKRDIWLKEYFNIIFKAKNKMKPLSYTYTPVNFDQEDQFASTKIRRFSKITRRELLYRKYNETQIILLAQVLQKASRRMGVDPDTESGRPFISQEFNILTPAGERETYVERIELDPQSQYNLARRLLRKDMVDLQMMSTFTKMKITHEDVVMAAFETGYISLEDLEFVVKYDDLWNPTMSPFQKVLGFVFRTVGYGTFFLPPPFNIAASVAMGIVEGLVDNQFKTGAENDNPATFIE